MSTFRGVVVEFPDIRIDFFRPVHDRRPPRACFLSHVHTDHLDGLENKTFHGNFLYCSPATREMLLRLKKYPQRLNFAKGLLETTKVTYEHLKDRVKTIPLETPTCIELEPGNEIQVTLFDANHCAGAVMFLIEGNGNAILYTGDIRSEPWFVNNLTRNPFLIEYTCGLRRLDCIYLDTINTRLTPFPTKAEGLRELVQKVSEYPVDTVFHFEAWTFGYEEVWMVLSRALKSPIHVDNYKLGLYSSLRGYTERSKPSSSDKHLAGPFLAYQGPVLTGYTCGNTPQAGCLTDNKAVRVHSCEKGMHCEHLKNGKTVWIKPIITRSKHGDMEEIGEGGGGGDLNQQHLELGLNTERDINAFLDMLPANTNHMVKSEIRRMLLEGPGKDMCALSLDGISSPQGSLPLKKFAEVLTSFVTEKRSASLSEDRIASTNVELLPRKITFPYSRHSSYTELCHLVKVFNPKDVYPCTVDEANWEEDGSMEVLFGQECSASTFRHDLEMRELHADRQSRYASQQTHTTATSDSSQMLPPSSLITRTGRTQTLSTGRAQPVLTTRAELIGNYDSREKVAQLRILFQGETVTMCMNVLVECKADFDAAARLLSVRPANQAAAPSQSPQTQQKLQLHRNSEGKLRLFDPEGNQVVPPALSTRPNPFATSFDHIDQSTPPQDIIAQSPGSESQNLKRKAIDRGMSEDSAKRSRPRFDGPSSPTIKRSDQPNTPVVQQNLEIDDGSKGDVDTPGSELDTPQRRPIPKIHFLEEVMSLDSEENRCSDDEMIEKVERVFWDTVDCVFRCKICGHETWSGDNGFCTGDCLDGPDDAPYFEWLVPQIGDPRRVPLERPRIVEDEYVDESEEITNPDLRRELIGEYLDDDAEAYDTVDEEPDYLSEYDIEDSIIDDASTVSESEEEDTASTEDETDYKQDNEVLQASLDQITMQYYALLEDHETLRRDFDMDNDDDISIPSDIEDMDNEGLYMVVDVNNRDPTVFEIVLDQAENQTQESEISPERVHDRAKAFEAVQEAGEGWQSISLLSTADNHTIAEVEL